MLKKPLILLALLCTAVFASGEVEVNHATEAQLDGIKGLGPAMTRRILSERRKGEFQSWQDLMARVKGIRGSKAAELSESGLRVGGKVYEAR